VSRGRCGEKTGHSRAGGKRTATLEGDIGLSRSLAFSPDGRVLVMCGDREIKLWRTAAAGEALELR
jgi:hypothetical protein